MAAGLRKTLSDLGYPQPPTYILVDNKVAHGIASNTIEPKTFHCPVITPFELELGLSAREWDSTFSTDIVALMGNGESDLQIAVEK
eukprot:gene43809-54440_t